MGRILGERRSLISLALAVVFIGGAYLLAKEGTSPPIAQASQESDLLQTLATRDSTGDGVPDWEKALYGIPLDATSTDYFHLGMTDGEAIAKGLIVPKAIADVPQATPAGTPVNPDLPPAAAQGTLTASFAQNLFTLYLNDVQAKGGQLTNADLADIANQAFSELGSTLTAAPPFKTPADIKVAGSGPDAMKQYAASAEAVMTVNTANASKSELEYLSDYLNKNDQSALPHIASLASAYRKSAAGIAALPVPSELAAADLALVNSLAHLSEVTNDLTLVNSDPLASMIALDEYPQAVSDVADAFIAITKAYKAAGVTFAPNEPGASFAYLIDDVAQSEHPASTTPKKP